MVEIEVRDVGDVKDVYLENHVWTLEEGNEKYFKGEFGL